MARTAEVGHDKLLNLLDSGSPPLGTTSRLHPEKSDGWAPKVIHVGKRTLNMDHFCSIFVPAIRAMALSASILRRAAFV
jgi:hypothetical protein